MSGLATREKKGTSYGRVKLSGTIGSDTVANHLKV